MARLTALFALLVASPALGTPFEGLYRPNYDFASSWDCATVGMEGGAVAVEGDVLHGVGNACQLTDPVEVRGMNAVLYDAICTGEGDAYSERVLLMSHDFGIYVLRDGLVLDWLRCEE